MPPKNKGTGPKNLAKTMSPKAGRVSGGHSVKPPGGPKPFNKNTARQKTNPTRAK